MSFLTIGHSLSFRDATTNKMLHFEYGSAGSSIGPFQAFYLGHKVTKVRFSPETAAEFFSGQFIAPCAESAFSKFLDIAFMNQGHTFAVIFNGKRDGSSDKPF